MAGLRLGGWRLRAVRRLAENPLTRSAVWRSASADFRVDELVALGPEHRGGLGDHHTPVQGAPPRSWEDAGLAPPDPGDRVTARSLREAYAKGDTTPVEVLDHLLRRLSAQDFGPSTYSPFIALDEERAREAAEASAARYHKRQKGKGPLDGIPVPIKDELHMAGLPTRGGTTYMEEPAEADAFLIERLRQAGAVLPGKAHATEWGMNPVGYAEHYDLPRNPYRADRGAGGSSTGSGVAVALGMAPAAIGSDGGGSIRIPATLNGVFGLKPTYIRIGRTGNIWGSGTMAHLGPIGASTEDLVDLLSVAAGIDPQDPTTANAPDKHKAGAWQAALGRGVKGCRVGVLRSELAEADPAVAKACEAALQALQAEGAVLVDVECALASHAAGVGALTIASETAAHLADDARKHGHAFGEELRMILALMHALPAQQFLMAGRTRTAMRRQCAAVLRGVDVLALPSTATVAAPYALAEGRAPLADTSATAAMSRFMFLANLTGLPAGSVPVGMHESLPVGLQIMGDAWDEASVIAVMAHLERAGVTDVPRPPGHASPLGS